MAIHDEGVLRYKAGETVKVDFTAQQRDRNETLVLTTATFELKDANGSVKESGSCEITGSRITAYIGPEPRGTYTLELTVPIGREVRKPGVTVFFG